MGSKKRDEVIVGRGVGRPGGISPKIARTLLHTGMKWTPGGRLFPPPLPTYGRGAKKSRYHRAQSLIKEKRMGKQIGARYLERGETLAKKSPFPSRLYRATGQGGL